LTNSLFDELATDNGETDRPILGIGPHQHLEELMAVIESDEFAGKFLLAANTTDWLCHWLSIHPAVQATEEIFWEQPELSSIMVTRAKEMFKAPAEPNYRTEHEPALCSYAFILAGLPNAEARKAVIEMEREATPAHGWLRRLLRSLLSYVSISQRVSENYLPPKWNQVLASTKTDFMSLRGQEVQNLTPFDTLTEYWTLEEAA
jgi:hypothetical protein